MPLSALCVQKIREENFEATLHKKNSWGSMQISKKERKEKLLLFNVAEAARMLGIGVNQFHMDLIGGYLPKPKVQICLLYTSPSPRD